MSLPIDLQTYAPQQGQELTQDSDELVSALLKRKRRKLRVDLSEADKRSIAVRIVQDFFDASATNTEFRLNHVEFMNNWRGTPAPNDNGPLGSASANVKVPLTSTFIEQWKSRLMKVIFGDEEDFVKFYSLVEPLETDVLKEIAKWFCWELINVVDIFKWGNDILHYTMVDGLALPIPYYDCVVERRFTCREFDLRPDAPLPTQIEAAINQCFAAMGWKNIQIIPEEKLGTYTVICPKCEEPADVTVLIDDQCLILEIDADETIFDGVKIELPNIEDVIVVNTAEDVDKLPFFGIRTWLAATEIDALRERGVFDITQGEFENVIAFASAKISDFIPQITVREQDIIEGADSLGTAYVRGNDYERRWVEIYKWEGWIWFKNQRIGVAIWLAPRSYTILRIELLTELNNSGSRSPIKIPFINVPSRFYSVGLAEWLRNCQTEIDGVHNFRLNSAFISTAPYGFYSPMAGFTTQVLDLQPGKLYPVKDPSGVNFPNRNWSPVWGFQEEGLIRKYSSELAGIGDPGVGTYASKRTSATEFMGTTQAIDIRTEFIAKNILRNVEQLLYRIFGLYQQHACGERVYQIAGADGEELLTKTLSMDKLQGKLKLQLTGNVRTLSKEIERQTAMSMLSILLNQFTLQMGIVKPDTVYSAIKKVFEASDYKGVPLHMPDIPPDSPAPLDEWKMMQAGIYPPPHMGEDFGGHLQAHTMTMSDPDLENKVSRDAIMLLGRHVMETQQMYQQVQMQRQAMAIMAQQQQAEMAKFGIQPQGQPGSQQGETQPGTPQEGVANAPQAGGGAEGGGAAYAA